jgi:hypothetical protein
MVCENSEVKIGSKSAFVMLFNLQKELTKTTLELCLFYQWAGICGIRQFNVKSILNFILEGLNVVKINSGYEQTCYCFFSTFLNGKQSEAIQNFVFCFPQ